MRWGLTSDLRPQHSVETSGLFLLEWSHVVAEGVEFHFHSGEVHLMECGHEATEGGFSAVLNLFVGQEAVDS